MHRLLQHGSLVELERAWRGGCGVDAVDEFGRRALYLAASAGREDVVRWLLDHGARIALVNAENRRNALHAACAGGHCMVVRMLLDTQQPIDLTARDIFELTAPELAGAGNHLDIIRLLINHSSPAISAWLKKAAYSPASSTSSVTRSDVQPTPSQISSLGSMYESQYDLWRRTQT